MAENEDRLMTVQEVAKMFAVKPITVREWLRTDVLKGVKINSYWRVWRSEAVRFANQKYGGDK